MYQYNLKKPSIFKYLCFILIALLTVSQYSILSFAKKPVDTQPPSAPQNLSAISVTQTSVSLKWTASADNKGIASYQVYKNATYLTSTTSTSYTASALSPGTTYTFYITAKDYSGNTSLPSSVLTVTAAAVVTAPAKIITGYYASWSAYSGYTPLNIPAAQLTKIHYAFAVIGADLKIAMGDSYIDPINFSKLNELKKTYPHLKTVISVGGWEGSERFSDAALTDSSRTVFADSVVSFVKQYGFDGVDLDWEYPVSGGLSTNVRRPEDKTNFTLLLQKLREKLDAQGALDGKKYTVSIAGGASTGYTGNTELNLIGGIVDYAIIMTYDIHGTWDKYTDLNAPLYNPSETSPQYKWSVDSSVKAWTAKAFPASKIVLGVPFYGYLYNVATSNNNGLYQTFTGGNAVTYDKIVSTYLNAVGFAKYNHPDAMVPWLFNGTTFISYDDEQSIAAKASYIKQSGLAGGAIWELSQNKNGALLNALFSNLK